MDHEKGFTSIIGKIPCNIQISLSLPLHPELDLLLESDGQTIPSLTTWGNTKPRANASKSDGELPTTDLPTKMTTD